jgi:hypothetical protein
MTAERNDSMTGAKRHSLGARLHAKHERFRHSGSREATVWNPEKTLLSGYPFDFAQGGESFDFAQDREPVEPRITTKSCPV